MAGARAWWILGGTCLGLFALMLDSTQVVLALPTMSRELDLAPDAVQWVQNAYLLTLAAAVIPGGRLGDILGRRNVFIAGIAVFAAGAVAAAIAATGVELIAARLVQGVGAAIMFPLSLAMVSNAFPRDRQATAVGLWAALSSVAMGVGPLLGGLLVSGPGWRWIFWTYLPLLAIAALVLRLTALNNRDPSATQRIDLRGLATVTIGLGLVTLALVEADTWRLGALTIGVSAAGVALLALFCWIELRVPDPLVEFSLFRNRPYFGATIAAMAIVGSYWTLMFFEPQYLQGSLGYSVAKAGILILPITIPIIFISSFTGRWLERLGPRRMISSSLILATASLVAIIWATGEGSYAALFPAYLAFGIAMALLYAPVSAAAMATMPREKAGIAAGAMGMLRLTSGVLCLAVAGAVFQAHAGQIIDAGPEPFQLALSVLVAASVVAVISSWRLLPTGHRHEPDVSHHRFHF
jgi:EmrB/QacA subfamily drug resistance transporter